MRLVPQQSLSTIPNPSRGLLAFYAIGGLRELIPIYPLYAVMFGIHGISPLQLSVLFMIWAAVGLLVEMPSGALADRYSKKWLIVLAGLFKSAAFLSWFFWQDFWGYALGFCLWGAGSSLRSGAFEALLYEYLGSHDQTGRFAHHYGRIRALATVCILLGEASGGLLIGFGFDAVLLISAAIPIIVSLPFCFYVPDLKSGASNSSAGHLVSGFTEVSQKPALLVILGLSTLLLTVHGIFDEYVPPLLFEHEFSLVMIALVSIPIFSAQALGEFLADRFEHLGFSALITLMLGGAIALVPAALLGGALTVVGISLFFFLYGMAGTLVESRLQTEIESTSRATITSIIGLGDSLGAILWFALFGLMAEWQGFKVATLCLAGATILLCLAVRRSGFPVKDP